MTGSLDHLAVALAAFLISHFGLSWPPVRGVLVARLGRGLFLAVYGAVSLAAFIWAVMAFADAPLVIVWEPPVAFRHLPVSLMPLAFILFVAGFRPAEVLGESGPVGIYKVTRHPMMWAVGLWAGLHMLANDDAAALMLAGSFGLLALGGAWVRDRRLAVTPEWQAVWDQTSFVPLAAVVRGRAKIGLADLGGLRVLLGLALYGVVFVSHQALFGVSPLPLP